MIYLNENLRNLRKKKGLTQEQLAIHLTVSPQAISRWENGINCPDVTMLPIIANYYKITTDELLGVDITKNEVTIENIIKEAQQLQYAMKRKEAVEVLQKGLTQFPNNFKIMSSLIVRLLDFLDESNDHDINKNTFSMIFDYGDRIMSECMDDDIRQTTIAYIAGAYNRLGDKETAKKMVMKLSSMASSREVQLQNMGLSDDVVIQLQQNIWDFCGNIYRGIEELADIDYKNKYTKYSFDERIELLKKMLKIFEVLFENNDFGFYFSKVSQINRQIAACYANQKDKENTMVYIKQALESAKKYDEQKKQNVYSHSSLIFNQLKYSQSEFVTRNCNNEHDNIIERLKQPRYDFIRDDENFNKLTNKAV